MYVRLEMVASHLRKVDFRGNEAAKLLIGEFFTIDYIFYRLVEWNILMEPRQSFNAVRFSVRTSNQQTASIPATL